MQQMDSQSISNGYYRHPGELSSMDCYASNEPSLQSSAAAECGSNASNSSGMTYEQTEHDEQYQGSYGEGRGTVEHQISHMGPEWNIGEVHHPIDGYAMNGQAIVTEPRADNVREVAGRRGANGQAVVFERRRATREEWDDEYHDSPTSPRPYELFPVNGSHNVSPDRNDHTNGKPILCAICGEDTANTLKGIPMFLTNLGNTASNRDHQSEHNAAMAVPMGAIDQHGVVPHALGLVDGYPTPRTVPRIPDNTSGRSQGGQTGNYSSHRRHNLTYLEGASPSESSNGWDMAQQESSSSSTYPGGWHRTEQGVSPDPSRSSRTWGDEYAREDVERSQNRDTDVNEHGQYYLSAPGSRSDGRRPSWR